MKLRGIYAIICTPTARLYVGCSEHVQARWRAHLKNLRAGTHACPELQQAWNSFGGAAFRFELLQSCARGEPLLAYENLWMEQFAERLLNAMPQNRHGIASRHAMSDAQRAAWLERYAEGRARLGLAQREQVARGTRAWARKPEVRARMRKTAIESGAARYMRTPEAVARNAVNQRGVPKSPAQRANMSRAHSSGICRCHPTAEVAQ